MEHSSCKIALSLDRSRNANNCHQSSTSTETERGEQKGFTNASLLDYLARSDNPAAHADNVYWPIHEQEALFILSMVSLQIIGSKKRLLYRQVVLR